MRALPPPLSWEYTLGRSCCVGLCAGEDVMEGRRRRAVRTSRTTDSERRYPCCHCETEEQVRLRNVTQQLKGRSDEEASAGRWCPPHADREAGGDLCRNPERALRRRWRSVGVDDLGRHGPVGGPVRLGLCGVQIFQKVDDVRRYCRACAVAAEGLYTQAILKFWS